MVQMPILPATIQDKWRSHCGCNRTVCMNGHFIFCVGDLPFWLFALYIVFEICRRRSYGDFTQKRRNRQVTISRIFTAVDNAAESDDKNDDDLDKESRRKSSQL